MNSVFQSNDPHGNIVVNFRQNPVNDLVAFAMGYHNAAKRLVGSIKTSSGYPDYDGYPIVFLYRQALELYLKAIAYRGICLFDLLDDKIDSTSNLFSDHNLTSLFNIVKEVFVKKGWSWDVDLPGLNCLEDFETVINEFMKIDAGSYSFRYPINTKKKAQSPVHTMINVIKLADIMDTILEDVFDGAALQLDLDYQNIAEAEYEFQKFVDELSTDIE